MRAPDLRLSPHFHTLFLEGVYRHDANNSAGSSIRSPAGETVLRVPVSLVPLPSLVPVTVRADLSRLAARVRFEPIPHHLVRAGAFTNEAIDRALAQIIGRRIWEQALEKPGSFRRNRERPRGYGSIMR